ncbi:MAG TPA: helix-hairpin-helix domain-containing protein [Longimicrobiales bacterium]|nr:helix-hairpin-helix domain-containing protein [Longimicrobiales bacterium]
MQLATDEARALAFIACLIGLALLGRWVDRPRPLLPDEETVDIVELRERSVAAGTAGTAGGGGGGRGGGGTAGTRRAGGSAGVGASGRVDLNRAGSEELQTLPGIGPAMAARILAYRDSVGRFSRPEQLDSVRGVGPALLARLLPLVHVSP